MIEKLRRDFDDLISNASDNAANLLSKDLLLLQNLLEEKAPKSDLKKLKEYLTLIQKEDKSGEGLAGKVGYRCLSCNRAMAGMRTKPLSMNFTGFVNHLPNPKNKMHTKKSLLDEVMSQTTRNVLANNSKDDSKVEDESYEELIPINTSKSFSDDKKSSGKLSPGRESRETGKLPCIN